MRVFVITLFVCLVLAVGAGFYFDWLSISTAEDATHGKTEVRLTVDKEKAKKDLESAKERASEIKRETIKDIKEGVDRTKEAVHEMIEGKPVEGTVQSIDTVAMAITVTPRDGRDAATIELRADTVVQKDDREGTINDLKVGDAVAVHFEKNSGTLVARKITVK